MKSPDHSPRACTNDKAAAALDSKTKSQALIAAEMRRGDSISNRHVFDGEPHCDVVSRCHCRGSSPRQSGAESMNSSISDSSESRSASSLDESTVGNP